MSYISAGFIQITTAAQGVGVHEHVQLDIPPFEQDGYVLAYLSNENQEAVNVHFDDFTVYHGKTNVVSTQDYYPFGLTFNESVRVASVANRFKYNSFEFMEDLNLNLYDYQARYYDPAIGRFIQVDPAADLMRRHSPYNYAFDNPIRYIDPDGMIAQEVGKEEEKQQEPKSNTQKKIDAVKKAYAEDGLTGALSKIGEQIAGGAKEFVRRISDDNIEGDGEIVEGGNPAHKQEAGASPTKTIAKNEGPPIDTEGMDQLGKDLDPSGNVPTSMANVGSSLMDLLPSGSNDSEVNSDNSSNQVISDDVQITPVSSGGEIHTRRITLGGSGRVSVEKYYINGNDTLKRTTNNGANWAPYKQKK